MKVTRTWRRASGEVITREYDYPNVDRRRYVMDAQTAARNALAIGPLMLDGPQRKYVAHDYGRAFNCATINKLIEQGAAVRDGDIVRRAA